MLMNFLLYRNCLCCFMNDLMKYEKPFQIIVNVFEIFFQIGPRKHWQNRLLDFFKHKKPDWIYSINIELRIIQVYKSWLATKSKKANFKEIMP
jgi:hypothetical protein